MNLFATGCAGGRAIGHDGHGRRRPTATEGSHTIERLFGASPMVLLVVDRAVAAAQRSTAI